MVSGPSVVAYPPGTSLPGVVVGLADAAMPPISPPGPPLRLSCERSERGEGGAPGGLLDRVFPPPSDVLLSDSGRGVVALWEAGVGMLLVEFLSLVVGVGLLTSWTEVWER